MPDVDTFGAVSAVSEIDVTSTVLKIRAADPRVIYEEFRTGSPGSTALMRAAEDLVRRAREGDHHAFKQVHLALDELYNVYFTKPQPNESWCDRAQMLAPTQKILEAFVIEYEDRDLRGVVAPRGQSPEDFVRQIKADVRAHPANLHPFYLEYLPNLASRTDLRFYLAQETALDPRFDDFIALMQLGCEAQQKLELAGNYWDEMGNGEPGHVHTTMFSAAMHEVGADPAYVAENRMAETLVCGNLSAALALNPRFYYRAIGSFAVTEFLFPRRCAQLLAAWTRNRLSTLGARYHREHIGVDARHASGFFRNVIRPEIAKNPDSGVDIYWGAMARMNSSQRYLDALLARLQAC